MIQKKLYQIGELANLMGMSRDTLRYYEKHGLISSRKGTNGYRYYTDDDSAHLVSIMYQRKMNIPISAMAHLWQNSDTISTMNKIMAHRLEEETLAVYAHQQTIARLKLAQADCSQIEKALDHVVEKAFPSAYVIDPHTSSAACTTQWFELARQHSGLDMMYSFDEYVCSETNGTTQLHYQNTQLLLYQWLKDYVDYPIDTSKTAVTIPRNCLSMFCTSIAQTPSVQTVKKMLNLAKEMGVVVNGQLFSTRALQGLHNGQYTYYLELYMPILS